MMLHSTVEFAQLKTIVRAAASSSDREAWDCQLRRLISGMSIPLPGPNTARCPAHDFQFETYVAAIAELSGYNVSFAKPDVMVRRGGHTLGIAEKRARSMKRIEKNCQKATDQICQSGMEGVFALDISFALYPNQCVNTNDLLGAAADLSIVTYNF